jgi:hypothetical protein
MSRDRLSIIWWDRALPRARQNASYPARNCLRSVSGRFRSSSGTFPVQQRRKASDTSDSVRLRLAGVRWVASHRGYCRG